MAGAPPRSLHEGPRHHRLSMAVERPDPTPDTPPELCLEKGSDYDEVRDLLEASGFTAHIRARGEEAKSTSAGSWLQRAARGRGAHA